MPNLHPIFVHFTLALFVTAVIFDVVGYLTKRESLISAAWWNLLVAVVIGIFTVVTGLNAAVTLPHTEKIHEIMGIHEKLGIAALAIMLLLLLWRAINHGKHPSRRRELFFLLSLIGLATIIAGGYYGGEMVYHYGMGITPMMGEMNEGHHHHHDAERPEMMQSPSSSMPDSIQTENHDSIEISKESHDHEHNSENH